MKLSDPMGTVYRSSRTSALLIRCTNRLGHPGWKAVYFEPESHVEHTYFYYDIGGWDDDEAWVQLTEVIVGNPYGG